MQPTERAGAQMTLGQQQTPVDPGQQAGGPDRRGRTFLAAALVVVVMAAVVITVALQRRTEDPKPAPTPSIASIRAHDTAAAARVVIAEGAAYDAAVAAGSIKGTGIEQLAGPGEISNLQAFIDANKRAGYVTKGTGKTTVLRTDWSQVGARHAVVVQACSDGTGVTTTDAKGRPAKFVNPDGTPVTRTRVPVTVYTSSGDGGKTFQVDSSAITPDNAATC